CSSPEYANSLKGGDIVVIPDNDDPGQKHADTVLRSLVGVAASLKRLELPDLPPKGDTADWLAQGGTRQALEEFITATPIWVPPALPPPSADTAQPSSPWDKAVPVGEFLAQEDPEFEAYVRDLVVPGAITIVAAPRTTGKSITALALAIALASAGKFR